MEHAKDTSDLFNSGVLESICQSSACKFVYVALISLCAGVTVICRLWRWMMICFTQHTTNSLQHTTNVCAPARSVLEKSTFLSLPAHLNFKMPVKKIIKVSVKWTKELSLCLHFVADSGWSPARLFCWKVHRNPYDSNSILLRLIHPENIQPSDRDSRLLNPGGWTFLSR